MYTYIILSEKKWNANLIEKLSLKTKDNWVLITSKETFNEKNLKKINPAKIFIPHWSYIIPSYIYNSYECILFHMTDLPFGRGGSPLQNLILRGYDETKISALKVDKGLDTGDIYIKKKLSLKGSAKEIFQRANEIIFKMIIEIIQSNPKPFKQIGKSVLFKRRTPEMSSLKDLKNIDEVYNYIRMLDCDGYPKAFIGSNDFKFEFSKVIKQKNNTLEAHVRIIKK